MDWNDDDLQDLLVGENNGQVRHFRNIGTVGNPVLTYLGLLQVGGSTLDVGDYSTPWTNDWNGDGLIDLLVGGSDGFIRLYLNAGTNANPTFNTTQYVMLASGSRLDVGYRSGPNVVDLNGDNVKDVVSGEMGGKVYYFQNNGTNSNPLLAAGAYLQTGAIQFSTPGTARSTPVDWNNDGDMDLVVGSYDSRLKRYMQVATTVPAPTCDLTLTSSYTIPASGGNLTFTFAVNNATSSTVTFDAWTDVDLPNAGFYGPVIEKLGNSLAPFSNETRNVTQAVPASAPTGYYYYYGYVGNQSTLQVYSQDYFYFNKTATSDGSPSVGDWTVSGWELDNPLELAVAPADLRLCASPNPFNPQTILRFTLPEEGVVNLTVYNLTGQEVATLVEGYRAAGAQMVTWDATAIPSGVYLATLQLGTQRLVEKLILTK